MLHRCCLLSFLKPGINRERCHSLGEYTESKSHIVTFANPKLLKALLKIKCRLWKEVHLSWVPSLFLHNILWFQHDAVGRLNVTPLPILQSGYEGLISTGAFSLYQHVYVWCKGRTWFKDRFELQKPMAHMFLSVKKNKH